MADVPSDIFFATIEEINAHLLAKDFSCRDLTRAFCDRFEALGPRYNAVALSLREQALRKAGDVDDDLKRGRTRGPLQGIPYAVKDLLAVERNPTTWGARPFAAQVFDENAKVVDDLNGTGAILIGKLSMIELAGGGGYVLPSASMQGPGRNPWDRNRWAGGSSSGCGSAVAAGLVTFAIGSETSGSILTPSAFCGVTGFRPTFGRVSRRGAMTLSWTLDKLGPMCRTAVDCALVLHEIAGDDRRGDADADRDRYFYTPQFNREPKEITIGYAPVDFDERADPEARDAFRLALDTIRDQGFQLKEVALPDFPYGAMLSTVLAGECGSIFEDFIRSGEVDGLRDPEQIAGLKAYLELPSTDYLKAQRLRTMAQEELRTMMLDVPLFLAPTRYSVAPPLSQRLDADRGRPRPTDPGMSRLIPAGNLAGLPALSVPCGFADGLPLGLQIVGRANWENQVIQVGKAYQDVTDWHRMQPPDAAV